MTDVDYAAVDGAGGRVLHISQMHPRQISTAHNFVISSIEKAIHALMEAFVSLEKVINFIINLRHVKLLFGILLGI